MGFFKVRYVRDYVAASKIGVILGWIIQSIFVIVLGGMLAIGFGKTTVMQEGSMEPTLMAGETVMVNRLVYQLSEPKRGDIIAFRLSEEEGASTHIKRVIGLPGDKIQIVEGQIIINGETYQEHKNFPSIQNPGIAETKISLESGEYFVLGDNRNDSEDSRFADIGMVAKKNIIGKIWFRILPWEAKGLIKE